MAPRTLGSRLLRYGFWTAVNLTVLVVVVAIAAPLLLDPNDYKQAIAEQVQKRIGRQLTIVDDMQFSVLPWLGVSLGEARLGNATGFGDAPFASVDAAQLRVKLLPLIRGEVQMDTVSVRGLELHLARDADGRGNWQDLIAPRGDDVAGDPAALGAFALGGIRLEDARLSYTDAVTGRELSVTGLDLTTGPVSAERPVAVQVAARFDSNAPALGGRVEGATQLQLDLSAGRYTAEALSLESALAGAALGERELRARLAGTVGYDQPSDTVAAQALTVELSTPAAKRGALSAPAATVQAEEARLRVSTQQIDSPRIEVRIPEIASGDLKLALAATSALDGRLASGSYTFNGLVVEGTVIPGATGGDALPYRVAGDLALDLPAGRASAGALSARIADLEADASIQVDGLADKPAAEGRIAIAPTDLRALLARAGIALPATGDPRALSAVSLDTRFRVDGEWIWLNEMAARVDGASVTGALGLPADRSQSIGFDLAVDRLELDRYLPPRTTPAPASAVAALPVQALPAVNLDGRLQIGALRYADVEASRVDGTIKTSAGRLYISSLSAQLFGGSYQSNIRLDASGAAPTVEVDERISNVDLHALLSTLGVRTGALDLSGGRSELALKGKLSSDPSGQRIRAHAVALDGRIGGRSLQASMAPLSLRGAGELDLGAGSARLDALTLRFADLVASGALELSGLKAGLQYAGKLAVEPFDLRAFARRLDLRLPITGDPRALTAVGGEASLRGDADRIAASGLKVALDGSTVGGNLEVRGFARPAIAFDLAVDRLDTDRYLPPKAKGAAATPGAAATALPVELVRELDLNGTLKVADLRVGGLKLEQVALTATSKGGTLKLSPLGALLYGGRYAGNVSVDAREQTARVSVDETVEKVRLGPLLTDLRGDAPITGVADLRAVLSARGGDSAALTRSLNGDVSFNVTNGQLPKIDMVNSMCSALAALDFDQLDKRTIAAGVVGLLLGSQSRGGTTGGAAAAPGTEFTELKGSARITDGVARNDDLVMTSPIVRVSGAGSVDLGADRIDYLANAELVRSCAGIGQRDLSGQVIPVKITGAVADPKLSTELPVALVKALTRSRRPATSAPSPGAAEPQPPTAPQQAQPAPSPAPQPTKPGHVLKDLRDEALKGILKGILK